MTRRTKGSAAAAPVAAKGKPPRRKGQPLADPIRERYAGQRAMGFSQSASFRNADPKSAGKTVGTIRTQAGRLEADPDVQERKAEILADMLRSSDALLSKRQLAELICDEIREAHREPGCLAAASGLVDKYCKMFGFYEPERHEVGLRVADESVVNAKIAALLEINNSQRGKD